MIEFTTLPLAALQPNKGQIPGLPTNPRQWTKEDIDKIAKSLKETPELFEARPIIVYPFKGKYVILGGNLRYEGSRRNLDPLDKVPVAILPEDTTVEKMMEIVIKDNGSFGSWDYDTLANEWDVPLLEWGVPAWDTDVADMGLSTRDGEKDEDYQEFEDKFKPKLTTDDCYTPPEVYAALLDWIDENVRKIDRSKIVRPFYPGGDYENETYPKGCVVIDNPPFSLYSKIVRFYEERQIPFFLFGPGLTLLVQGADVTYIIAKAGVEYENGAIVSTGFVTNMVGGGVRIWCAASVRALLEKVQKRTEADLGNYAFPPNVWTSARLQKIANGDEDFIIKAENCTYIRNLESLKADGKGLYGGGILTTDAVGEAAERAAERAAAIKYNLSERERDIVEHLNTRTPMDK